MENFSFDWFLNICISLTFYPLSHKELIPPSLAIEGGL